MKIGPHSLVVILEGEERYPPPELPSNAVLAFEDFRWKIYRISA